MDVSLTISACVRTEVCRELGLQVMLDGEVKCRKKNRHSQNFLLAFSKGLESRLILLQAIPELWIECNISDSF
jgi:hypothetical protein